MNSVAPAFLMWPNPRMRTLVLLCLPWLFLGGLLPGPVQGEPSLWVFEGQITRVDPDLAPDLVSGWVLAGSFLLDPLEMEEMRPQSNLRTGRLEGGISRAELTIDLYHQIRFEATQVPGLVGFDYHDNDPDQDGRDLLGWFFPVRGRLGERDWHSAWLQVWLADPEGRMLLSVPPKIPPHGYSWETGWFRLTFLDTTGREAHAEGRLSAFLPADSRVETDREAELSAIIADLGSRLVEREQVISGLREELAGLQDRLGGLRRMVDLLVEERSHLQGENARLEERIKLINPQTEEELAALTADRALLEAQLVDLEEKNRALAGSLGESESRRRELMDRLAELELAPLPAESPRLPSPPVHQEPLRSAAGQPVGTLTLFESLPVVERTVYVPVPIAEGAPPPGSLEAALPEESRNRRLGPRKFR